MNGNECSFEGCDRPAITRGFCSGHYAQWRRGAELSPIKPYVRRGIGETKECSMCNKEKSWDDFSKRSNGRPQSACKVCLRQYNRTRNLEIRQKAILWDLQQENKKTVGKDPQIIKEEAQ